MLTAGPHCAQGPPQCPPWSLEAWIEAPVLYVCPRVTLFTDPVVSASISVQWDEPMAWGHRRTRHVQGPRQDLACGAAERPMSPRLEMGQGARVLG